MSDDPGIDRDALVIENMAFAISWAKKYCRNSIHNRDDLFAAAKHGLVKASRMFDPSLGYAFTTYASYWIRSYLALEMQFHLHQRKKGRLHVTTLEAFFDRPEILWAPEGRDPDDALEVHFLLGRLKTRERAMVEEYFGIGRDRPGTLNQVGRTHGVTKERVRQIIERSLRRMRRAARA